MRIADNRAFSGASYAASAATIAVTPLRQGCIGYSGDYPLGSARIVQADEVAESIDVLSGAASTIRAAFEAISV